MPGIEAPPGVKRMWLHDREPAASGTNYLGMSSRS